MSDRDPDLGQTLEYRSTTAIARLLPTGLMVIVLGLLLVVLTDASATPEPWARRIGTAVVLATGVGVVAVALWRRGRPGKPVFTLSPEGIRYRWSKEFLIPWHEIQAVDTINVVSKQLSLAWLFSSGSSPLYRVGFHGDVTVVVVSKRFYDQRIYINSFFLRGPGWKATFMPQGDLVQVALHHELVSVAPRMLRAAVESRWLAFRDRVPPRASVPGAGAAAPRIATPSPGAPQARPVAMGDDPRAMSRWQVLQVALALAAIAVLLANVAGLWQLSGQGEAREARARTLVERKLRDDARRQMQEETRQREADDRQRQKENEETLRRAFGR